LPEIIIMALDRVEAFALRVLLEKLRSKLSQTAPELVSSEHNCLYDPSSFGSPGNIEALWNQRLQGNKDWAESVLAVVHGLKENVQPRVKEALQRIEQGATLAAREDLELLVAPFTPTTVEFATTAPSQEVSRSLFAQFCSVKDPERTPKLPNLQKMVFRGLSKCTRNFSTNKPGYPTSGPHCIDISDREQVRTYEHLKKQFEANSVELEYCGRLPAPDYPSYNNDFCKTLVNSPAKHAYYLSYLEVVFSGADRELMCRRLRMRYCAGPEHQPACAEAWARVKTFAQVELLQRLKLDL